MLNVKPGQTLEVEIYKADGRCYRRFQTTLEAQVDNLIVTFSRAGGLVIDESRQWVTRHAMRGFYWLDRPYNLLEVYENNGRLVELYVNVADTPRLSERQLHFTDYELDVVWYPPGPARIVDQDEFAEAIDLYGYTPAFQQKCYAIAAAAAELVNRWRPHGLSGTGPYKIP